MTAPTGATGWRRAGKALITYVVIPIAALLLLEGLSSVGLLLHDIRTSRSSGNFRRAAYDSLMGWVAQPNMHLADSYGPNISLTTNADGMRIRPTASTATSSASQRRIICSGDSFTFGSGVADTETFCANLEREFPGVTTLNMAQQGYGIDQMYLWYMRDAVRYPHQVHLLAFIWNDLERMALTSFTGYPKPRLSLEDHKLHIGNMPVHHWTDVSSWPQVAAQIPDLRVMQFLQRRFNITAETKMRRAEAQEWDIAEAVFGEVRRLNAERGSTPVLVYLPTIDDLNPGPLDVRRARLATFAQRSGMTVIDLTPEMRAVPPDSSQWLFLTPHQLAVAGPGGHYSAAGHRWVAARLAEHLRAIPTINAALTPVPH